MCGSSPCRPGRSRAGYFLRAGGFGDLSAAWTVRQLTLCLRSITRPGMPASASRRMA
jgi:hypothetical protein